MGTPTDDQVPPGVSAGLPPPNWYPDPQNPSRSRYWDGTHWTEDTHSLAAPTVAATYRPLVRPARTLFFLFAVTLVLTVVALLSDSAELNLLGRIVEDPASVSAAEANASDQRQGVIGLLQLLVYLGTVVAFLVWFRRAYRNLPALGAESLRFSSGWAVGAWFVPFLNLVRPKQLADETSGGPATRRCPNSQVRPGSSSGCRPCCTGGGHCSSPPTWSAGPRSDSG